MPIVFLAAAGAAIVYLLRGRRPAIEPRSLGVCLPSAIPGSETRPRLAGIHGWLLVYVVALAAGLAHDLALIIGSVVVDASPSLAGLHSFTPLWALLIYVVGNLALVAYGAVLFILMSRERKAAVPNNILFNALSITFLVIWFVLGVKSPIGTVVDSLPGLAGIAYFSRSRRVRNTFTATVPKNDRH